MLWDILLPRQVWNLCVQQRTNKILETKGRCTTVLGGGYSRFGRDGTYETVVLCAVTFKNPSKYYR